MHTAKATPRQNPQMPIRQDAMHLRIHKSIFPLHAITVAKRILIHCVVSVMFLPVLFAAEDVTYVLQNGLVGYEGTSDTILIAGRDTSGKNYGALSAILVGDRTSVERRTLLRFDLSKLKGAKITKDAVLELTQVNLGGFPEGTFEIGLFLLSPKNASWIQGTGDQGKGVDALPNEPAWDFRVSGPPRESWLGGLSVSGEASEPQIATFTYDTANNRQSVEITIPAAIVQSWIDSPDKNGGVLMMKTNGPAEGFGGFFSSEHNQVELRPKLIIKAAK